MAESKDFITTRVLNAPRQLVWDAYSEEKHLLQWWGPAGVKMAKATLDFKSGGMFHYGMYAPDGSIMWGKLVFGEIVAPKKLVCTVSFSDENAGFSRHPLAPMWPLETLSVTTFEDMGAQTKVTVNWKAINCSEEEAALFDNSHDGMNYGMKGTFDQLNEYIKTLI